MPSWLSPHFPRAAHLTREDFPENPISNTVPLPPSPCFFFQQGIYYSLKCVVWLSDFSHWNISCPRAETFILLTAVDPESSSILTHSRHSANTELINTEWARTTCLLSFAREHGGRATFANPLHYESFRCPKARVNSLQEPNSSDGWVLPSTVA